MAKSSFWCGSLALAFSLHAAEPPTVVDVWKNSGGEQTQSRAIALDASGLLATVTAAVEERATFSVGSESTPAEARVALFEASSRVLLLRTDKPAAAPATFGPGRSIAPLTELRWVAPTGPQPARLAGPLKQLEGKALALTLLRVHFAEAAKPTPGTPLLDAENRVVALALSPLADQPGAWLALPAEAVQKVASDFEKYARSETARLEIGIAVGSSTPRVEVVKPNSRGAKAGLQPGDVILRLGDRPIVDCLDILDANFYLTSREPTPVTILRGLDKLELTAPVTTP